MSTTLMLINPRAVVSCDMSVHRVSLENGREKANVLPRLLPSANSNKKVGRLLPAFDYFVTFVAISSTAFFKWNSHNEEEGIPGSTMMDYNDGDGFLLIPSITKLLFQLRTIFKRKSKLHVTFGSL